MSEVETATVACHEPALFDAPPTHMRVPLAIRAVLGDRRLPCAQRSMWVPFRPSDEHIEELLDLTADGSLDDVRESLLLHVQEYLPGAVVARGEPSRIVNALARNRMMPIPKVAHDA